MPTIIRFPAIKRVYMFAITSSQSKASATKTYGNHIIKEKYLRKKMKMQKWQTFAVMCLNFIGVLLLVVRVCTGKTNNKNCSKILAGKWRDDGGKRGTL